MKPIIRRAPLIIRNCPRPFSGNRFSTICLPDGPFDPKSIEEIWKSGRGKAFEHSLPIGDRLVSLNTQFRVIKDETGEVQGILGISRDITEKKKIEQQMFNTEKLASLGLMSAGVAHEINNPLAVILGYCDYMLEKLPPEDKFHRILQKIERQGEQLQKDRGKPAQLFPLLGSHRGCERCQRQPGDGPERGPE